MKKPCCVCRFSTSFYFAGCTQFPCPLVGGGEAWRRTSLQLFYPLSLFLLSTTTTRRDNNLGVPATSTSKASVMSRHVASGHVRQRHVMPCHVSDREQSQHANHNQTPDGDHILQPTVPALGLRPQSRLNHGRALPRFPRRPPKPHPAKIGV